MLSEFVCSYLFSLPLSFFSMMIKILLPSTDIYEDSVFLSILIRVYFSIYVVCTPPSLIIFFYLVIAGLIGITYQTISLEHLLESFHLEANSKELADIVSSRGWKVVGEFVSIPPNEELTSRAKKAGESFNLDRIFTFCNFLCSLS